jgi:hypothetical protein
MPGGLVRRVERLADTVAQRMVDAFAVELPAYRDLAAGSGLGDEAEARVLELCRQNLRLFLDTVESGELPPPDAFAPLRSSAAARAAEGVPLEQLLAAYHVGARVGWEAMRGAAHADEHEELLDAGGLVILYTDAVSRVVSVAYLEERLRQEAEAHAAEWALVDAFLAGRPTTEAAARAGRMLAGAYAVLLLEVAVPRDRLRAFEAAIAEQAGPQSLWRLTAAGANVLVPVDPEDAPAWVAGADAVVETLAEVAGAPLVATVAWGEGPDGVARAGDEAVQVLRLASGLGRPQGLYRLDDVLLEAALGGTAAGPAARLAAILAPLESGGPELLATLEAYVAHDADRRRAAAALHVHPNTLDYRLRRIADLTGRSPATARGLQVLGAALTLRRVGRITGRT